MMKSKNFILALFMMLFSGCIFDETSEDLHNGYKTQAIDGMFNMSLSLSDGQIIIPNTVFAVGKNNSFIIVKQHPEENMSRTNYYIVPLVDRKYENPEDNFYGPMTYREFQDMQKSLKIEDIKFTIVYPEIE